MDKIEVSADALQQLLTALIGPPHLIRELQATRVVNDDSPINVLLDEYNAAVEDAG